METKPTRTRGDLGKRIEECLGAGYTIDEAAEMTGSSRAYASQIDWKLKNPEEYVLYVERQKENKKKQRRLALHRKHNATYRMKLKAKREAEATREVAQPAHVEFPVIEIISQPVADSFHFDIEKYQAVSDAPIKGVSGRVYKPVELNPSMTLTNTGTLADMVNNPPHYNVGGVSVFDFIEAKQLNYGRGNVIKYVTRAGVKSTATELQDLEKAQWYLTAEIERLKGKK